MYKPHRSLPEPETPESTEAGSMLLRSIRASLPTVVRRLSAEAATAAAEIPEAASASAAAATSVDTAADTAVAPEAASASAAVDTAVVPVAEVPVEASASAATDKAADSPATTVASASTAAKVSEGAAVIRQRDEGGRTDDETQLRRTISMLRKFKRYERALELCRCMTLRQDVKLFPRDYTVHLELIDKVHGLRQCREVL
ncbi:hypothetical protein NL676_002646 [Syzygium grande]|nr:hypothetical protein NL676_002646 [Syzygium grande]